MVAIPRMSCLRDEEERATWASSGGVVRRASRRPPRRVRTAARDGRRRLSGGPLGMSALASHDDAWRRPKLAISRHVLQPPCHAFPMLRRRRRMLSTHSFARRRFAAFVRSTGKAHGLRFVRERGVSASLVAGRAARKACEWIIVVCAFRGSPACWRGPKVMDGLKLPSDCAAGGRGTPRSFVECVCEWCLETVRGFMGFRWSRRRLVARPSDGPISTSHRATHTLPTSSWRSRSSRLRRR